MGRLFVLALGSVVVLFVERLIWGRERAPPYLSKGLVYRDPGLVPCDRLGVENMFDIHV
ncbi:hypothetical protein [Arthrobacter sp. efr-133-TYG-120]|uniref:hypothetical protein n=1 Tax=Arthrobacter sp. efr-133-TYG-120 TaxID=3040280 RepID=UPI00254FF911|nr:hypothetical protein [Arthrobacter sp. efr-133-TYG-120]